MNNQADNIKAKAAKLFSTRGIKATTIDEIAKSIHVSKKTVFKHFIDKSKLVEAITYEYMRQLNEGTTMLSEDENAEIRLQNYLNYLPEQSKKLSPIFLHDLECFYPHVYQQIDLAIDQLHITHLESLITTGIQEQRFQKNTNITMLCRWYRWQLTQFAHDTGKDYSERAALLQQSNKLLMAALICR